MRLILESIDDERLRHSPPCLGRVLLLSYLCLSLAFGFDWLGRRSMIDAIPLAGGVPIFFCETWCVGCCWHSTYEMADVVGGSCDGDGAVDVGCFCIAKRASERYLMFELGNLLN